MKFLRSKFAAIWISGISAAMLVWIMSVLSGGVFSLVDTLVFDSYQRLKPRVWGGGEVAIVDIDERSIRHFGQWPWPRTVVADLVDELGELGAAAIVFDVVFSESDRTSPLKALDELNRAGASVQLPAKTDMLDNDVVLSKAFARHAVVTGFALSASGSDDPPEPKAGVGFIGTVPDGLMRNGMKAVRNLAELDKAATGIGEIGYVTDDQGDAVVRRTILLNGANGQYYPSLAMEALRVAQGAGGFKIKSSDGSGEAGVGDLAIVSAQVGALTIPTDAQGALEVYHSPFSSKTVLPVHAVLNAGIADLSRPDLEREIANRIVLIGTSAAALLDLRATPLDSVVPGVTIHAEIIDQIISGTYLKRPDYARGVELLAAVFAVLILLSLLPRLSSLGDALTTSILLTLIVAGCWYAFASHNLLFSPVVPVLSVLLAAAAA